MDSELKEILDHIDQHKNKLYETVSELVSFRSINPCGEDGKAAQKYMASKLTSLGLSVNEFESFPGVPNVVGVIETSHVHRSLLLTGHIDVFPAKIEEWDSPPFETVISDGKMFGRGTSDMKGSLAGFLIALEPVLKVLRKNVGRIIYATVFGEEIGQSGTRFLSEQGGKGDFAILGEPSQGHSLHASIGVMSLCITLNDVARLHLGARRNFIHAGGGLIGANCIEKMATHIIIGLRELERSWGVIKIHPYLPAGQALISPFRIQGGEEMGLNPSNCKLCVAVFYLPNEKEEEVKKEIEEHLRAIAACDIWLKDHPPLCEWDPPSYLPAGLPTKHDGFIQLCHAYKTVTGKEIKLGGRGAITDAGWLLRQGIPTVVYGAGDITTAHGKNEYVYLDDLLIFTKTMATFIYQWMKAK